jgi:hypothetical protein
MNGSAEFDPWEHVRHKRVALASLLASRTVVFLDLNYWIRLRDAKLGKSSDTVFIDMLATARHLVSSNACVFPITDSMFHEVRKQSGDRLKETLDMIDELSQGVCIHNRSTRVDCEILDFLQPSDNKVTAKELLWTKPYFLFINKLPFDTPFDKDTEIQMQRLFADDMWEKGFSDLVDKLRDFEGFTGAEFDDNSDSLNAAKINYTHEYSTFHELFMNEIAGAIDTVKDEIIGCWDYLYQKSSGNTLTDTEKEKRWNNQEFQKGVYNVFRVQKAKKHLPYIHVMAACHAVIRWDENLRYDGNHQFDFEHAACALPYSDVFFTERQLKHLVTQNQLKLDELYSCEVIAKAKDALAHLKNLSLNSN